MSNILRNRKNAYSCALTFTYIMLRLKKCGEKIKKMCSAASDDSAHTEKLANAVNNGKETGIKGMKVIIVTSVGHVGTVLG